MRQPIISQAVFDSLDRNKDGFVSKGELKLKMKTDMTMKQLGDLIDEIDANSDGKLTYDEVKEITKKSYEKKNNPKAAPAPAAKKSRDRKTSR